MIIWVASFPRSGNTLLRILLRQVFSLGSYCKYKSGSTAPNAKWDSIGFRALPWPEPTWKKTYKILQTSEELCPVRTHDIEKDGAKTIYVVRDARSVLRSYYHFLRDLGGKSNVTMKKVINGGLGYGSWSKHLSGWEPYDRPDTLVIRYEDILDKPEEEIQRLEAFLGISAVNPWENQFEEWQEAHPKFFFFLSPKPPVDEYTPEEMKLFWKQHGEWMHRLGYGEPVPSQA